MHRQPHVGCSTPSHARNTRRMGKQDMLAARAAAGILLGVASAMREGGNLELSSTELTAQVESKTHLVLAQLEHNVHILADALSGVELLQEKESWW